MLSQTLCFLKAIQIMEASNLASMKDQNMTLRAFQDAGDMLYFAADIKIFKYMEYKGF